MDGIRKSKLTDFEDYAGITTTNKMKHFNITFVKQQEMFLDEMVK